MIWEYLEKGAAVGAWVFGLVLALALALCLAAFVIAVLQLAFGRSPIDAPGEEPEEGTRNEEDA